MTGRYAAVAGRYAAVAGRYVAVAGRYAAVAGRYAAESTTWPERGHDVVPLRGTGIRFPCQAIFC